MGVDKKEPTFREQWLAMSDEERANLEPSGRTCVEEGCDKPAGTPWGPYRCPDCDDARIELILQVQDILDRLSYKPNTVLELRTSPEGLRLALRAFLPKVDSPDQKTSICSQIVLQGLRRRWLEHEVLSLVQELVRRHEEHEIQEWLRLDGVPLVDPHPEKRETDL